jgi:hypothetical protein
MILYVNGDSHAAAAEAVNAHAFAEDDCKYFYMGRAPHPDNLAVSWGNSLAGQFKATLKCDAESAASNDRIIRTTRAWLDQYPELWYRTLVIISWSTWEREEWLVDNKYYQINASGTDVVPESQQTKYKEFVANVDWQSKTAAAHNDIWQLHCDLNDKNIRHVFFNGNNDFSKIKQQFDWGASYIGPYDPKLTYNNVLKNNKFATVSADSWHFGKDAHSFWASYMLKYCINHNIV